MASVALVLSILVPSVGNWWYLLTLLSPAAWFYYFQKGERVEQVRVGRQVLLQLLLLRPRPWQCLLGMHKAEQRAVCCLGSRQGLSGSPAAAALDCAASAT